MIERTLHPLLRYGMPNPLVPIATNSHFIMFDTRLCSPIYTMHRIVKGEMSESAVERDDDFVPAFELPPECRVTAQDYAEHNSKHPDNPMDRGHLTPSRTRRSNQLVQHDVDSLAGVIPQTPQCNRGPWKQVEDEVFELAQGLDVIEVRCAQGPGWRHNGEINTLRGKQAIPHFCWKSVLVTRRTKIQHHGWIVDNDAKACRAQVGRAVLERITGMRLWPALREIK